MNNRKFRGGNTNQGLLGKAPQRPNNNVPLLRPPGFGQGHRGSMNLGPMGGSGLLNTPRSLVGMNMGQMGGGLMSGGLNNMMSGGGSGSLMGNSPFIRPGMGQNLAGGMGGGLLQNNMASGGMGTGNNMTAAGNMNFPRSMASNMNQNQLLNNQANRGMFNGNNSGMVQMGGNRGLLGSVGGPVGNMSQPQRQVENLMPMGGGNRGNMMQQHQQQQLAGDRMGPGGSGALLAGPMATGSQAGGPRPLLSNPLMAGAGSGAMMNQGTRQGGLLPNPGRSGAGGAGFNKFALGKSGRGRFTGGNSRHNNDSHPAEEYDPANPTDDNDVYKHFKIIF